MGCDQRASHANGECQVGTLRTTAENRAHEKGGLRSSDIGEARDDSEPTVDGRNPAPVDR